MQTQLLCTFSTKEMLNSHIQNIRDHYDLVYDSIYILQNKTNLDELFITYNIDSTNRSTDSLPNTILVHRKKDYNTIYTINALNQLIRESNNGILDKSYNIEWESYKNMIIITNVSGTQKIATRIFDIVKIH